MLDKPSRMWYNRRVDFTEIEQDIMEQLSIPVEIPDTSVEIPDNQIYDWPEIVYD